MKGKKFYLICSEEYCGNMPSCFAMDSNEKYYGDKTYPELRGYPKDVQYWKDATSSDSDRGFHVVECYGDYMPVILDEIWKEMDNKSLPARKMYILSAEYNMEFLDLLEAYACDDDSASYDSFRMVEYLLTENCEFLCVFNKLTEKEREEFRSEHEEVSNIFGFDLFEAGEHGINVEYSDEVKLCNVVFDLSDDEIQ